jgi:uncharacterized membrane protein YczE
MFQGHDAILVNVLGNGVNMMGQWEYDEHGYGLGNVLNAYLVGGFKDFLFSIIYAMSSFPLTFIFFKMVG